MQLLAGTDAGTEVRGHVQVWGEFCCSVPQYGRCHGSETRDTHTGTHTHTGTYTRMLHLPFSREGANREKLTVKKIINNEMFFSPFMSLISREKLCVNREKIGTQNPPFFHR